MMIWWNKGIEKKRSYPAGSFKTIFSRLGKHRVFNSGVYAKLLLIEERFYPDHMPSGHRGGGIKAEFLYNIEETFKRIVVSS